MKGWHLPKNGFDPEKKEIGPDNLADTQNAPFLMKMALIVISLKSPPDFSMRRSSNHHPHQLHQILFYPTSGSYQSWSITCSKILVFQTVHEPL
jgi:hypothetical protein